MKESLPEEEPLCILEDQYEICRKACHSIEVNLLKIDFPSFPVLKMH